MNVWIERLIVIMMIVIVCSVTFYAGMVTERLDWKDRNPHTVIITSIDDNFRIHIETIKRFEYDKEVEYIDHIQEVYK